MAPEVRGPLFFPGVDPAWFGGEHALGSLGDLPAGFEAYGLLLHRLEAQGQAPRARGSWREVAARFGLAWAPSIVAEMDALTRRGAWSWAQEFFGPADGCLDREELQALLGHLGPMTGGQACFFYYCFMHFIGQEPLVGRAFVGPLAAVTGFLGDERVRTFSPTFWWPVDRRWFVMSGYDSYYSVVAGPRALIDALVADPALEVLALDTDALRRGLLA